MSDTRKVDFAMDSAAIYDPIRRWNGYQRAKALVEAVTGIPVLAEDTASVFREGCHRLGVDAASLPASALPAFFSVAARGHRGGSPAYRSTPADRADFDQRFPGAGRVRAV